MTRIPGFERRRDREADVLFSLLEDDLKIWVKSGSLGTQKPRPEFFDLAITLHTSIVCSRRIYKVWRTGPTEWAFPHQSPRPWQMKDVDTWRLPIRPQKQPVLVCNLSLGLQTQRNVDSRSEPLTLVKPTVLVCEVEEAYGEHDRSRSPRSSSTSRRAGQDSYAVSPKGQGILSNMFSGQSQDSLAEGGQDPSRPTMVASTAPQDRRATFHSAAVIIHHLVHRTQLRLLEAKANRTPRVVKVLPMTTASMPAKRARLPHQTSIAGSARQDEAQKACQQSRSKPITLFVCNHHWRWLERILRSDGHDHSCK
jgi:hypothetical protein